MIRIFVSIVFAFSILAASSAHASMLPKSLGHIQAQQGGDSTVNCGPAIKHFVIKLAPNCKGTDHKRTGSLRCHVDIAPLIDGGDQFSAQRLLTVGIPALKAPKDWLCEPILGPPRRT